MEANFQRIARSCKTEFEIARKYYLILFGVNDIHLTKSELDLVAFSAVNGTLSTPPIKQQFSEEFGIPTASIYNMIGKLKKLQIIIKDTEHKYRINPIILPDFALHTDIVLVIKMNREDGA